MVPDARQAGQIFSFPGRMSMKNPFELLRAKEQEILAVKRQIEALRIAARLMGEEEEDNVLTDRDRPGKPVKLP
jgi:hypothetical protein